MAKGMAVKIAAVVVVIAVIAAAAVVLLDNDGKDPEAGTVEVGSIYGNVDGNGYIDDTDIRLVQEVLDGKKDLKDWPLADVNANGAIDDEDLTIVKKLANGESTTASVVDNYGSVVKIGFPLSKYAVMGGTNMRTVVAVLGLEDGMLANGTTKYISPILDKKLYDLRENGRITALSSSLTTEDVNTLTKLGVTTVISEDSGMSSDSDIVKMLGNLGISFLELNVKDLTMTMKTTSTLGILSGTEGKAEKYNAWTMGVMDTIKDKEGSKWGTASVMCVTMSNSVSGTESDYYKATQEVGGKNLADWSDKTKKFNKGDTWLLDSKYNAEYIFHFKSMSYPDAPGQDEIDKYLGYFSNTYTYKEAHGYYLINGVLPLPVRNAIMAQTMYGDCFDEGWAQSILQQFVSDFLGIDYDTSKDQYIWHP